MKKLLSMLLISLFLAGCGDPPEADIIGEYAPVDFRKYLQQEKISYTPDHTLRFKDDFTLELVQNNHIVQVGTWNTSSKITIRGVELYYYRRDYKDIKHIKIKHENNSNSHNEILYKLVEKYYLPDDEKGKVPKEKKDNNWLN